MIEVTANPITVRALQWDLQNAEKMGQVIHFLSQHHVRCEMLANGILLIRLSDETKLNVADKYWIIEQEGKGLEVMSPGLFNKNYT